MPSTGPFIRSELNSTSPSPKSCHPERTGPQTLFSLGVVSRRICGCFSFVPFNCFSAGSIETRCVPASVSLLAAKLQAAVSPARRPLSLPCRNSAFRLPTDVRRSPCSAAAGQLRARQPGSLCLSAVRQSLPALPRRQCAAGAASMEVVDSAGAAKIDLPAGNASCLVRQMPQ